MAACDNVIERAMAKLEEVGYTRNSVKVIGASMVRHVCGTHP